MSLVPHTSMSQVQRGSYVINESGQKLTVLGFSNDSVDSVDMRQLRLHPELSSGAETHHAYGLYFNEKVPERQEVIAVNKQDLQVLTTLMREESRELALGSPFCNREIATYFMELLKDQSSDVIENEFKRTLVKSYLAKGFSAIISELKADYVSMLQDFGLSKVLLNQLVSLAGMSQGSVRQSHGGSIQMAEL